MLDGSLKWSSPRDMVGIALVGFKIRSCISSNQLLATRFFEVYFERGRYQPRPEADSEVGALVVYWNDTHKVARITVVSSFARALT